MKFKGLLMTVLAFGIVGANVAEAGNVDLKNPLGSVDGTAKLAAELNIETSQNIVLPGSKYNGVSGIKLDFYVSNGHAVAMDYKDIDRLFGDSTTTFCWVSVVYKNTNYTSGYPDLIFPKSAFKVVYSQATVSFPRGLNNQSEFSIQDVQWGINPQYDDMGVAPNAGTSLVKLNGSPASQRVRAIGCHGPNLKFSDLSQALGGINVKN